MVDGMEQTLSIPSKDALHALHVLDGFIQQFYLAIKPQETKPRANPPRPLINAHSSCLSIPPSNLKKYIFFFTFQYIPFCFFFLFPF